MSQSQRASEISSAGAPTADVPAATAKKVSLPKHILFSTLATALCFLLLEGGLAMLGVRPAMEHQDPYLGFSSHTPLFTEQVDAQGQVFLETAQNHRDFFNVQRFPKKKPMGTYRIFSLGGSTTYGHPYFDSTSFNGWLREYLLGIAPEHAWEAINAGGISYGTERDVRLMTELSHFGPDLFLVYSGHNEFLERQIHTEINKSSGLVRELNALARHTRTATVMESFLGLVFRPKSHVVAPGEALEDDPVTLLDNTLGPSAFSRDAAWQAETLRRYRLNLERMTVIAQAVGARVIFITPASNLRDVAPFKSEHRTGLSEEVRHGWKELFDQARADFRTNALPTNGLAALDEAIRLDELPANLHYVRGRILEKLGRFPEAKAAYERAREEDVCPLRALSTMRPLLLGVAAEKKVPVVDFERLIESLSEHGITGGRLFLDHVHPTVEAHRLLALEILKTMEGQDWVHPDWDPARVQEVTQKVLGRINTRTHSLALMNLCKTLGWAGKREEAYRAGLRAVDLSPEIPEIQYEAGLAANLFGRPDEAIAHLRRAVELNPKLADAQCAVGVLLETHGDLTEAISHLRLAIQHGKSKNKARDQGNLAKALELQQGRSAKP